MIEKEHVEMRGDLQEVTPHVLLYSESHKDQPKTFHDKVARVIVRIAASFADFLFQNRYGHRAVVLETIAAVPGMVGGLLQHLKSLRFIRADHGWIRALLDEAENERMHLLIYSEIAKPSSFERFMIIIVQFFFYHLYFLLYLISPRTAHKFVGYLEEEAINSYEHYLRLVRTGMEKDRSATTLAISYWKLPQRAKLSDMIKATITDEMLHRDVNHAFADDKVGTRLWV